MNEPIRGAAVPARINLKPEGSRVGDVQRQRAAEHVRACARKGFLSEEEAGTRENLIRIAMTSPDLANLLIDLPSMLPGRTLREHWQRTGVYVPALGIMIALGLSGIIVPVIALIDHPGLSYPGGIACGIIAIAGLIFTIFCIIWLIVKLDS